MVVRREEDGLGDVTVGRRAVPLEDTSVTEELALELPIVGSADPRCLVGGGGGGDLWEAVDGGSSFKLGLATESSTEC